MKKAIWGTGLYASKLMYVTKREEIDFFIDNNKEKRGQSFFGKKVLSPDEIEDWEELYIYIPFNFYDGIIEQLKKYGINSDAYCQRYYNINKIDSAEFVKEYNASLIRLEEQEKRMKGFCLFWGRAWAFEEKGYKKYLQGWKIRDDNLKLGLVSEAIWYSQEETEKIMSIPTIVTPAVYDDSIYIENGVLVENQMLFLKEKKYVTYGVEYLRALFTNLTEKDAYYMIYYMYHYANEVLERIQPKLVILYALLTVQHLIVEEVCREKGIPLITTHPGILSGTLSFDIGGEMGKSLPALYPERFKCLPINFEEIEHAKRVWDYLYKSKLNRKVQPKNKCIEYIMKNVEKNKPIVFFAGQNDVGSNMVPYTEETRKYHSPIFKSSLEAGIYIAGLCKKNNWNYIYKPHPMSAYLEDKTCLPSNTIYVEYGDINDLIDIADVAITILSQTSYVSLIRYKPVVMLGFNQMKGKGCSYEAFEEKKIESAICDALKNGFTGEQREAFLLHIAQVLKYYVYDDLTEREIRFGRDVPDSIEEFYELKELLEDSDIR